MGAGHRCYYRRIKFSSLVHFISCQCARYLKVIDPSSSMVNLLATKVEVILKKVEPGSWQSLELPINVNDGSSSS
jgi:hypothetical protein